MGLVSAVVCVWIALVLVITKLLLENQYEQDKAGGIAGDKEEYTYRGMMNMIRRDRKEKKYLRRERTSVHEKAGKAALPVRSFSSDRKSE